MPIGRRTHSEPITQAIAVSTTAAITNQRCRGVIAEPVAGRSAVNATSTSTEVCTTPFTRITDVASGRVSPWRRSAKI